VSQALDALIEAVRALQGLDRRRLLAALSAPAGPRGERPDWGETFWTEQAAEDIAASQAVPVVDDIADLAADFWPVAETADSIVAYVYEHRRRERSSGR
jgi:hypothetical protein